MNARHGAVLHRPRPGQPAATRPFTQITLGRLITFNIITSLPKVIWEEGRVAALSHTYAAKSPLVTMARPKFAPKVPLSVDRSPNPTTCLIPGPVRPVMPNGIRIRSAVFYNALDRPTHRPTHRQTVRSSTVKFDRYRPLRYESDAA